MWRRAVCYISAKVSEERAGSIFRVPVPRRLRQHNIQITGPYLPDYTMSHNLHIYRREGLRPHDCKITLQQARNRCI
jgi:hypothetical protein